MATPVHETFFKRYLDRIDGPDLKSLLMESSQYVMSILESIDETKSQYKYAPDKWTIKEVVSHMIDVERVMAFRALWFGRGSNGALAGFDDVIWENNSAAGDHSFSQLLADYKSTRAATLALLQTIPENALQNKGEASEVEFTVDALFRVIMGHEQHHMDVLKERYLG